MCYIPREVLSKIYDLGDQRSYKNTIFYKGKTCYVLEYYKNGKPKVLLSTYITGTQLSNMHSIIDARFINDRQFGTKWRLPRVSELEKYKSQLINLGLTQIMWTIDAIYDDGDGICWYTDNNYPQTKLRPLRLIYIP